MIFGLIPSLYSFGLGGMLNPSGVSGISLNPFQQLQDTISMGLMLLFWIILIVIIIVILIISYFGGKKVYKKVK